MIIRDGTAERGVAGHVFRRCIHVSFNTGFHLEVGLKNRVDGKERIIPPWRTNDYDFDIRGGRLGPGRSRQQSTARAIQFFNLNFAVAQRILQKFPTP
jgi:hypothetical protein